MAEVYQDNYSQDSSSRLRDIEEKQRLLTERLMITGKTLLESRDKNFAEIQELKKSTIKMKEDMLSIKVMLQNIIEQLNNSARKEELMIIQRQLDLIRQS